MMNSKSLRTILLLTLFFPLLAVSHQKAMAFQQPPDGPELAAFFDEFLTNAMAEHHVPGAAIVFVKGSEIVFAKGYGYANLEKKTPVDPATTIFRWASVSKVFPFAGVLQMVDQGKMDLDADVNQYLRDWQVPNDFSKPIRVRDLLQHTDGFGEPGGGAMAPDADSLQPLGTWLPQNINSPVQEPGSLMAYGGNGPVLAGHLLEQVSGDRFEDHIATSFFAPLEMHHSTFDQVLPPEFQEKLAPIYHYVQETDTFVPAPYLYQNAPPGGGISAAPLDMAHFVIALLNDGRYKDAQILSPTSTRAMLEQQFEPFPDFPGVTFGFFEHFYNNQRGLIRDGSGMRLRAQIYLLPEHNLGYVYVQNTAGGEVIDALNETFLDTYYPAPDKTLAVASSGDTSRLAGFYHIVHTNEHTIAKLGTLFFGELRVDGNPDNSLTIAPSGMAGDIYGGFEGSTQWAEISPQVFQRIDRERYVAFHQDEKSQTTYLFSGSGYHGAYYKVNWYKASPVQLTWIGLCLLVFLSALVIWPFGLLNGGKERSVLANLARWVGSGTSLLLLIGLAGFFYATFKQTAGHFAMEFGMPPLAVAMLAAMLCGAIVGLTTPVFAILAWKDRYWSVWGRIHYTVLAVAALAFVWWLNYWNLLGFRY